MRFSFVGFCFLLVLASCSQPAPEPTGRPLVLTSIAPYQLFAERICGGYVEVRSIVPPGMNAHSFEPSPRYMASISQGVVWFRIGESFEPPLMRRLQGSCRVVDLREGIDLLPLEEGLSCHHCSMDHQDRHIWMSPTLAKTQAQAIAAALSSQWPEKAEAFAANLAGLLADLDALDAEIRQALEPLKERVLLVSHPAFGYYCHAYDLEQLSVEYEGKDPRPKHLEAILRKAEQHRPEIALALPQHNNKGAQVIAEKLHLPIKMIDPYSHDYFETMRLLTQWIRSPHE